MISPPWRDFDAYKKGGGVWTCNVVGDLSQILKAAQKS